MMQGEVTTDEAGWSTNRCRVEYEQMQGGVRTDDAEHIILSCSKIADWRMK
jgi:hypothetical protein